MEQANLTKNLKYGMVVEGVSLPIKQDRTIDFLLGIELLFHRLTNVKAMSRHVARGRGSVRPEHSLTTRSTHLPTS